MSSRPPATDATYSGWERFTLTGVVREEPEGRPLAGVIVRIQGSNTGTVTDGEVFVDLVPSGCGLLDQGGADRSVR